MSGAKPLEVQVDRGEAVAATPLVSVVIPAYRPDQALLEATLAAVRAQTFPGWELILVDDGSPEPVAPARTDDLVLVRQPNQGPGAARNTGCRLARGELIAFCDADDRWLPEKLARQVAFHDERPECVLSTTDQVLVDAAGGRRAMRLAERYRLPGELFGLETLFAENCIVCSAAVCRREAWLRTAGMDPVRRAAEDFVLWLRLAELGPVGHLAEVLVERTEHAGSLTATSQAAGHWQAAELEVYQEFLAERPGLASEGWVRRGLARAEFDRGYHGLAVGDWAMARRGFQAAVRLRPGLTAAWLGWVRAVLRVGPRRPDQGART